MKASINEPLHEDAMTNQPRSAAAYFEPMLALSTAALSVWVVIATVLPVIGG